MKILLLEYITAGGLSNKPLPASLLREGMLMRDAMFADLKALNNIEIITTVDARIDSVNLVSIATKTVSIEATENAIEIWQILINTCDAALIVAPESDGILSKLTQMLEASGVKNLGCAQLAVDIASNKYDTFSALKSAGILTIPTMIADDFLSMAFSDLRLSSDGYIVKPIDGAGCEQTVFLKDEVSVQAWLRLAENKKQAFIVQPYQRGVAASMSLMCHDGQALLLSCNQQNIVITETQHLRFQGAIVNGLSAHQAKFKLLADHIASAIPSLNGFVGVDVILDGDQMMVVEINPRVTTTYIALRDSLGFNPMRLLLDLVDANHPIFTLPSDIGHKAVEIILNA